ncbi:MAG: helix-turn-helix domain-containing protein [Ruminococcus sp.]
MEKIYTPKQAWELLNIGRTRFYQLLKEGKIRYFKNGNRYLIPESAILAFIDGTNAYSQKEDEQ